MKPPRGFRNLHKAALVLLALPTVGLAPAQPDDEPGAAESKIQQLLSHADGLPLRTRLALPAVLHASFPDHTKALKRVYTAQEGMLDSEQMHVIQNKYEAARRTVLQEWGIRAEEPLPVFVGPDPAGAPLQLKVDPIV